MNQRAASLILERLRLLLRGRTPLVPDDPGTRPRNDGVQKMRRAGRDYEDKRLRVEYDK